MITYFLLSISLHKEKIKNMPTIFSHPATVTGLAVALGGRKIPLRLFLFGVFCSVLPDIDVISFKLGINYANILGHRGFSHSLLFALAMGLMGVGLSPLLRCTCRMAFCVGFFAVASHILLDAMTNGGLGVTAFWHLDQTRYFCDWRPIQVSPLNPRIFFSPRGGEMFCFRNYAGFGCPAPPSV